MLPTAQIDIQIEFDLVTVVSHHASPATQVDAVIVTFHLARHSSVLCSQADQENAYIPSGNRVFWTEIRVGREPSTNRTPPTVTFKTSSSNSRF